MTKKEYCTTHAPIASHDYYYSHIHGIEYGIDGDYVYISQRRQMKLFGKSEWTFHKLKTKADSEGFLYIDFPERMYDGRKKIERRYLENYIRAGSAWGREYTIEEWLKELMEV